MRHLHKILLIILGFLMSACQGLFYHPDTERVFYEPEKFSLKSEDVYFDHPQGFSLHGWLFRAVKPKGLVVFFHGNAENLTSHFASLSFLPQEGYSYFIFDYPGYGRSEGEVGSQASVESGVAALKWAQKNFSNLPIFVYGGSLGGITALRSFEELESREFIKGIVLDGTFGSYQQIARYKLSLSWVTWLFQPLGYVVISDAWAPQNFSIFKGLPKLQFHGELDQVVEPIHGEWLFKKLPEPKSFIWVKGGQHGDSFWVDDFKYREDLLKFLRVHSGGGAL